MKVTLDRLKLSYFKGIKSLETKFNLGENFVYGANEAGKTTLFDAVWFLFFGKDSTGKADFSIKTYDKDNKVIEKVNHDVEGFFDIDGSKRDFKRSYQEQWKKSSNTLTGHTTEYHVDGFPKSTKTDYDREVSQYFTEETFKLLTNPFYFNSLKMEEKRKILLSLVPEISDNDVFSILAKAHPKSKHLEKLKKIFEVQRNLADIKLKISRDKRKVKEDKEGIQPRIDEVLRGTPEEQDWEALEEIVAGKRKEIESIDTQIHDASEKARKQNQVKIDLENQIFELEQKVSKFEREAKAKADEKNEEQEAEPKRLKEQIRELETKLSKVRTELSEIDGRISNGKRVIEEQKETIQRLEKEKEGLVAKFYEVRDKAFQVDGDCPYCGTVLSEVASFKENQETKFVEQKQKDIDAIQDQGLKVADKIKEAQQYLGKLEIRLNDLNSEKNTQDGALLSLISEIDLLKETLNTPREGVLYTYKDFLNDQYEPVKNTLAKLADKKAEFTTNDDQHDLISQKREITSQLEKIQGELSNKAQIEKANIRVEELKEQEKNLAIQLADIEGLDNMVFEYSKAKMEMVTETINKKFEIVHFKMFEMQMNGELKEVCDCIKDGVPFSDLNNAGKVQAGLDVIRTFNREYDLYLPVFVDNRESVTEIPKMETQVINLVVSPEDKKLRFK